MALDLIGANGMLPTLGKGFGEIEDADDFTSTIEAGSRGVINQADATARDRLGVIGARIEQSKLTAMQYISTIQAGLQNYFIETVNADRTLPQKTMFFAMRHFIDEMVAQGLTVEDTTVSAAVTYDNVRDYGAITGDGVALVSVLNLDDPPVAMVNLRPEKVTLVCVADANTTGRSDMVIFEARGEAPPVGGIFSPDWPGGSGYFGRIHQTTPDVHNRTIRGHTIAVNGNFETFTGELPHGWLEVVGAAGANFSSNLSDPFRGKSCLRFIGDGATLVELKQLVGRKLPGRTRCSLSAVAKHLAAQPTAGVLRMKLDDGAGNALYSSEEDITLSTLTAAYQRFEESFVTGVNVATGLELRLAQTTALSNGHNVVLDDLVCAPMHQLGPVTPGAGGNGGVYINILPGPVPFAVGDRITVTITNNLEGKMQKFFDRVFGMLPMGLQLPFSVTANVADSLIG